jgi:UDP-glucose 4-epimerase
VDNFSNSNSTSIDRVEKLIGKKIIFYKSDLRDFDGIKKIFSTHQIDSIIHFAGLKAVGESSVIPLDYYNNNVCGTINLLLLMKEFNIKNLVFSSSATVYGKPEKLPIKEDAKIGITNIYSRKKLIVENILNDFYKSDHSLNIIILRFFNPVEAHKSGKIGEDPNGVPNNLMPYISHVAIGKLKELSVFGDDYSTADGTGIRDYIHVVDLTKVHVYAIKKLDEKPGIVTYNLGTGCEYSVLEIIKTFEKITGKKIPFKIIGRRKGNIDMCYADSSLAYKEMRWKSELILKDMIEDTWRWQKKNPLGYK